MAAIKAAGTGADGELTLSLGQKPGEPFDIGPQYVALEHDLDQILLAQIHDLVHFNTEGLYAGGHSNITTFGCCVSMSQEAVHRAAATNARGRPGPGDAARAPPSPRRRRSEAGWSSRRCARAREIGRASW